MADLDPPRAGDSPAGRKSARPRRRSPEEEVRGRLRPHDPFELIRWLALSQPDPRKALAELVQNSLDAGARTIRVTRVRERGAPCLRIFDDGQGVIPEMGRPEALRYIATHIGHSRKRALSPQERLTLMTQGQYGIGLLGFWSLGERLEMRTSLPGQRPCRLVLHRDSAEFEIQPLRGRLPIDGRWTEVIVAGLHREAMVALIARRAADYLAAELRGQLLSREVELVVEDKMSRGRAPKLIPVRPPRFLGERLEGLGPVGVPGFPPARLEVYIAGDAGDVGEPRGLGVYSSGTLVAEGFHELAALGLDHAPWTDSRLTGFVDFPSFAVAPGSRRGVIPDEAAGAFARALVALEPVLGGLLEALDRQRTEEMDRTLIRDLQRAFRDFYRHRPRYSMLPVNEERERAKGSPKQESGPGAGAASKDAGEKSTESDVQNPEPEASVSGAEENDHDEIPITPPSDLLPAGPLAAVRIAPDPLRVECRGRRSARSIGVDATGRPVEEPVEYVWTLSGPVGTLEAIEGSPGKVILRAASEPGVGVLSVVARSEGREASAEIAVEVVEEMAGSSRGEGIPEPEFVHEPGASWRSRMVEGRWQVNAGHRDYRSIAERSVLKLRYLAMLFAKEVVLRSTQDPRFERPLEQLVEVAAYADRSLSERRGRRPGARDKRKGRPE